MKKSEKQIKQVEQVNKTDEEIQRLLNETLERDKYRALKRDLIGIEKSNVGEIILQKCSGKGPWFEIADHSALIYYYYVCQTLKIKKVKFEDDYDSFFEQYSIGRIRTPNPSVVRERLREVELYGREYLMNGRIVFVLKQSLTAKKLETLEKKEAKRRMDLNKTVEIEHSDPLFYRNLADLTWRLHQMCSSKLGKLASQTNGARIVSLADGVMADYLHSTDLKKTDLNGRIEDWKKIRSKIYHLKYEIQILDVNKMWSMEVCLPIFERIIMLKKLANHNLSSLLIERVKNEQAIEIENTE